MTIIEEANQAMKDAGKTIELMGARIETLELMVSQEQARSERFKTALEDIASHVCHPDCNHQEVAKAVLHPPSEGGGKCPVENPPQPQAARRALKP